MLRCLHVRWYAVLGVLIAGGISGASPTLAADPVLTFLQPCGFQRGTEVTVRLSGTRLIDATSLLLYRPGVQVSEVKPADDGHVDVKFSVAAECPLGLHAVRVCTATGISNLQLFSVGALPEVSEQEPNSEFAAPQAVPMGCTINGVVQNEDVDYFIVQATKGQRISVELEGVRLGMPPGDGTFFDPYVAILNAQRFELARCDDAALLQQDGLCAIVAPEDGTYVIEVRESAYGGSDLCRYRLHVGAFPRPTAVFPAGGRPGETSEVKWLGDPLGDWAASVTWPTGAGPVSELFAQDSLGIAPSPARVRVNELVNVLEVEPNNALDQATAATAPAALNGIIQQPRDVDHYKFAAKKGETYDVRVHARQPQRSPLDSVLTIVRSNGAGVVGNDDSGGPDSYVRFTAPEDDDYIVIVQDQLLNGAPDFVYRIEIAPVLPSLALSLPERIQYVPVTVSVPRGNRMAFMLNATRANFGGDLQLTPEGLPPGITVSDMAMNVNLSSIPVVFSAAVDAPQGGALVDLIGRPVDPNLPVVGHLSQRTMLVRGQNNVDVWGHDADRMAVAVTNEAPFTIEIVQPQVPIVRDGSMALKVVANRKDGYNEPIAVYLLNNPPGIGSSGAISIPAGQREGIIPLTANSSPAIGTWPIVALGRAGTGNGEIDVASQLAQLEIAEPFFTMAFEKSAAELGQTADVIVRITKNRDFAGAATAELLGLPAKTSTDPQPLSFTPDTQDLVYKVKIDPDARPGKFETLVCRAIVTINGEPITHTFGGGELRIDEPLPPKADAPAPLPAAEPAPAPVSAEVPQKPLTRLEQLRQQKQQPAGGDPAGAK
ncbi:MAG: PPC domain-containing protein [Pirellulaceae bacterium]